MIQTLLRYKLPLILALLLFASPFCAFSASGPEAYTAYHSLGSETVLPTVPRLGRVAETSDYEILMMADSALKSEYSLSWTESYIAPSVRKMFTAIWNNTLAEILPASSALYSTPVETGSAVSFNTFLTGADGRPYTFGLTLEKQTPDPSDDSSSYYALVSLNLLN